MQKVQRSSGRLVSIPAALGSSISLGGITQACNRGAVQCSRLRWRLPSSVGLSMEFHSATATEALNEPMVGRASKRLRAVASGPATVLLLAVWIGLIAGFLDLGLLVVNKRLINRDFYRLGC